MTTPTLESLLDQLTLEETVNLLAGASIWTTVAIERLGIPAIKVTDGPNGARGEVFAGGGQTSAAFPVGIALGSTWNPSLVEQIGAALGQETLTKGARVLLAPTVNLHRSPLNGRNFENYSEDPFLTARLAVGYIRGLQSQRVSATLKHYVCNDSEFERMSISSDVAERPLRELYLLPFEAAVKEANVWAVMSSYNKVNGIYASENTRLLTSILKEEWGFDGLVMSDWNGTYSTAPAVANGLDLEMPGPTKWRGAKLLQAVQAGEVPEMTVRESARRLLRLLERVGAFMAPGISPEQAVDLPEHRQLARRAAIEGMVLLKNEGSLLPLDPSQSRRIAVIGPNAKTARIMGGGSAQVTPHYAISPWQGLLSWGDPGDLPGARRNSLYYIQGCTNHKDLPLLDLLHLHNPLGSGGFQAEYYNSPDLSGEVVHTAQVNSAEIVWFGSRPAGVTAETFSVAITATFTARETGEYTFNLNAVGLSRLYLDGQLVLDHWNRQSGKPASGAVCVLTAGQAVDLRMEYSNGGTSVYAALRLGCMEPVPSDSIAQAAALARQCDLALLFVGTSSEWESEGFDRAGLELPGEQDALVAAVAAAQPNTVVILQTGGPTSMPWLEAVPAVLQAWFPGQECGNAIADVLFGQADPGGRLPQTFPARLEDNPAYLNYPGENGVVRYGEGLFIGYRYYDKKKITPRFAFGHGLSYTSFEYTNLRLPAVFTPGMPFVIQLDVTNTGTRRGQEVVQLYISDLKARLARPEKELKAFAKLDLVPGETQIVTLTVDERSLAYYDDAKAAWIAEAGEFEALIGHSSADLRLRSMFRLEETLVIGAPPASGDRPRPTIGSTIKELLDDKLARAVLEKHLPGFSENPMVAMALEYSLAQIAPFAPDIFTSELMAKLEADLNSA